MLLQRRQVFLRVPSPRSDRVSAFLPQLIQCSIAMLTSNTFRLHLTLTVWHMLDLVLVSVCRAATMICSC